MHAAKTKLGPERRAIERIKRKATAMAIAAAAEPSCADGLATGPHLEPARELHLRARSCRCPAANVKAYRDEDEWVCHTCGHQLSPHVTTPHTDNTQAIGGQPPAPQIPHRKRSSRRLAHRTVLLDSARSTGAG